ncbi:MAG: alpha/beta hydrolase [Alphaproteobacteria bacterium]
MLVNAALENPGLFDRLVLVSAPADDGVEGSRFPRPTGFIAKYRAAVAVEDWHEIARIHASNLVPEPEAVDLRKMVEMSMRNINHDIASRFFDSNPTMDITDLVNGLPMPVLVMHGTADTQAPFSGSEYLAQQIPNSQHYAFEGKGHIPMQTATKEFISALSKFLASTG